jgi:hypothetical protein
MANIKKSFNFRNGVQVDEDNLLVTSTGLVAIGKTVPTEALDVEGNLIVSGISSFPNAQSGVLTVTTFNPTEIIGAGVSIKSGVVTSTGGGGIVTFYGDGQYLQNLPSTQFVSSNTGIALTSQNCGIGTTNATSTLQVGGFPPSHMGVGISSVGNIHASGIITATTFVGSFNGNVTTATLADAAVKLQTARNIGGLPFDGTANIDLPGVNIAGNQNTSGNASGLQNLPNITITTLSALGNAGVDGNLNVLGNTTLGNNSSDNLTVPATSTFNSTITGVSGENKIPSLYSNMGALPNASTYHGMFAHVHSTGRGYFSHAGGWYEIVNKETDGRVGTGTEVYNVGDIDSSGTITAVSKLGVGVANPVSDIHLRKTGDTELQITSDTGTAGITVGRESGVSNTNNAEIRYGQDIGANYSSAQSFDLINYGTGNFNYHLSAANANNVEGNFFWHRGINNDRLMTLTGIGGSLGIGLTVPSKKLDVFGSANISSNLDVGGNLDVTGSFTTGTLNVATVIGDLQGNVTGNLTGLINSPSTGISTIPKLTSFGIGIGVTDSGKALNINSNIESKVFVTTDGRVAIGTDVFSNSSVNVELKSDVFVHNSISVGNTAQCAVDFSDVVNIPDDTGVRPKMAYMVPPVVTTSQRNVFSNAHTTGAGSTATGAFIYNSTINKLEVYDGASWTPLEANSGGGEVNQNAFSNISVSGQNTVQADSKTDTVTFVGGTGMTITTNSTGDEVTFTSSGGGGGSSLQSRTTDTATTGSLAPGAATNLNMTTAKSYVLQKITTNYAAWVTVYTDVGSRSADASRAETTDPLPGSGVIAEVITNGPTTQILSPGVIGWNNDASPSTNTYLKVVNKESSSYPITIILDYLKLED